jgi:hypothetical protein
VTREVHRRPAPRPDLGQHRSHRRPDVGRRTQPVQQQEQSRSLAPARAAQHAAERATDAPRGPGADRVRSCGLRDRPTSTVRAPGTARWPTQVVRRCEQVLVLGRADAADGPGPRAVRAAPAEQARPRREDDLTAGGAARLPEADPAQRAVVPARGLLHQPDQAHTATAARSTGTEPRTGHPPRPVACSAWAVPRRCRGWTRSHRHRHRPAAARSSTGSPTARGRPEHHRGGPAALRRLRHRGRPGRRRCQDAVGRRTSC